MLGLDRKNLISMIDNINAGLAPQRLYTLLNMYKVLVCHEEKHRKEEGKESGEEEGNLDIYLDSTILKIRVENMLCKEIISGYEECCKKLELNVGEDKNLNKKNMTDEGTTNIDFTLEGDHIKFDRDIKAKLKKAIEENLNNYV